MDPSQSAPDTACLPEDDSAKDIFIVPDYKSELEDAKTFLQRISPDTGDNMYDHLSDVLNKILAERPENVIDFFEEYSRKIKEQRYKPLTDHFKDLYVSPFRHEYVMRVLPFLKPVPLTDLEPSTADPEDEDLTDHSTRDLIQHAYYFEKAGIALPKTELYCLELCMAKLAKSEKLESIRFWGKIFGLYSNYYVVEAEPGTEEIMRRNMSLEEENELEEMEAPPGEPMEKELEEIQKRQEEFGEGGEPIPEKKYPRVKPPLPVSLFKPYPTTPREPCGEGVNKKIYFVSNQVGDPWVPLPDVTPQQIVAARQIVKNFSGNLDTEIISYPKFPGNEMNLLRAQIARISAGTQISPLGFYTFKGGGGEEEEEEEEEGEEEEAGGAMKTSYTENKRYEPHPMNDLTDSTMSFWVHHSLYIVPQGRTKWWNPFPKAGGGGEEEEEELGEEEEESPPGETAEPETGPPLLTPLSEDASLETLRPWSVRSTSCILPERAIAVVRSNLWPGAYAITSGKFIANIYVGYGKKHYADTFSPLPLPDIQEEYPMGPEIMETIDPTAEQEEEWRVAHLPPEKPPKEEGGEEEEGEEEEEEEEEDD